jgi:hypothetical protein
MPKKKLKKVSANLPFKLGSAEWEPDTAEQRAAWELYVELETRVAIQPLGEDEGLLREALSSLYSLFATTREILRKYGPEVGASKNSTGGIAIGVLNGGLRPFLGKWHPLLQTWERSNAAGTTSPQEHERAWEKSGALREELHELRNQLEIYAAVLAQIASVER